MTTTRPVTCLSTRPSNLYAQCERVALWTSGPRSFLVFGHRDALSEWQIAAYECDDDNSVMTWGERFDIAGRKFDRTCFKLMYGITNNLIRPRHIEDIRSTDPTHKG